MSYRFEGLLTRTDERLTRVFPFEVPEGTTHINVRLDYAPVHTEGAKLPQQISMSVYGPRGWVAEINTTRDRIESGTDIGPDPSPGTPPSVIEPGAYKVFLSTYRIVDVIVEFTLEVTLKRDGTIGSLPEAPTPFVPTDQGPGWYRGDLHAHTWHSDGSWDSAALVEYMHGRGLDFCTLTDHNTVTGLPEHFANAREGFLTLGGSEMSTYRGHMLALGVYERVEWRNEDGTLIPVASIAKNIAELGGVAVICHPRDIGDPWCCGCRWEHLDMMPGNAMAVEIWNGVWNDHNAEAVDLWHGWLNEGHHIPATSGTDHHGQQHHFDAAQRGRAAANVVRADTFTREGILDGLKHGRSYLSAGPRLSVEAAGDEGASFGIGDQLPEGTTAELTVRWEALPEGAWVDLVVDGRRERLGTESQGSATRTVRAGDLRWLAVDAWDEQGAWAFANPIYGAR